MFQEERYGKIMERLNQTSAVKVTELVQMLHVSVDTVRRDLEAMEKRGQLIRVHGGAVPVSGNEYKPLFSSREVKYKEEKAELASLACAYVSEGQAIAINAGTTSIAVAMKLAEHFERLTIITNSLRVVECFAGRSGFTIILPGGVLDDAEYSLYGESCESGIAAYNVDVAFIAIHAISLEKGLTDFRLHETGVIKAMMQNARQKIVIADSSKFDTVSYINVCPLSHIDKIVTDSKLNDETLQRYHKSKVVINRAK